MVASPISRYCGCGCNQTIDHMHMNTKYHPDCRKRLELDRARMRGRSATDYGPARKSQNPRQHFVRTRNDDAPNRRQNFCRICCGMPWARVPDRVTEGREGHEIPVSLDGYHCRECGEAYAPEPPPEPMSVLISSAALAAKEGELHGQTIERGFSFTVQKRKTK